jgi:putative transposase
MPRTARLDILGILHHVIVRGIERSPIFIDDIDRLSFITRLAKLLDETGTECLAWALLDNHIHLLVRPHQASLATFMRRLLTGHAITFNLRHKRSGHLFQNRYKSIVCEEEAYLLELVRYIHLNPLRAGIVKTLDQLDCYPWSGHAVVLGTHEQKWQNTEEVLTCFSSDRSQAYQLYRQFVADGIPLGHREDLIGGGLKRSQPDIESGSEVEAFDARILGSGSFVEGLLFDSEGALPEKQISLAAIAIKVASLFELSAELLNQRIRTKNVTVARSVFCYTATCKIGFNGAEVAQFLNQTRSAVSLASRRGAVLLAYDPKLNMQIDNWLAN